MHLGLYRNTITDKIDTDSRIAPRPKNYLHLLYVSFQPWLKALPRRVAFKYKYCGSSSKSASIKKTCDPPCFFRIQHLYFGLCIKIVTNNIFVTCPNHFSDKTHIRMSDLYKIQIITGLQPRLRSRSSYVDASS